MRKEAFVVVSSGLIIICSLFWSFRTKTEGPKSLLTMRTSEVMNGLWDNSITIVSEDSKVEKIELKRLKMGDLSQNLVLINENLNKITAKGYRLIATAEGGAEGIIMTTYTFEKE